MLNLILGIISIVLLAGVILYFSYNLSVVGLVIAGGFLSVMVVLVSKIDIDQYNTIEHSKVVLMTLSIPLLIIFSLIMGYIIHKYAKLNSRDTPYTIGTILVIFIVVVVSVSIYFIIK